MDHDLGIVVRIVVPPLSRYMCHRHDACRDSDRELVRQQVTAEVLDLRRQQSLANDASDRLTPNMLGGHRPSRLSPSCREQCLSLSQ